MSNQDCETPWEFIHAVEAKFGAIAWDLAANAMSCKARDHHAYFSPLQDSLAQDWDACGALGRTWLNPPYGDFRSHLIKDRPWLKKAAACRLTAGPLVLIPAAVCTEYFDAFVRSRAMVYELMPRVFGREVRDVILCDYREVPERLLGGGYERRSWRWK